MKRLFTISGRVRTCSIVRVLLYYLYILYSAGINKFYTGITSNIEKRLTYHNSNRSPYTKNKGPWVLVYSEPYETRAEAMAREGTIKGWKSSKRITEELEINIEEIGRSGPVMTG